MKYYTERDNTPLAFHSFIKCLSLPLGILRTLGDLVTSTLDTEPGSGTELYSLVLLVDLVLLVMALVGFIRWKGFGWTSFMVHLGLSVGYALMTVGIYAQYDAAGFALGNLLVVLAYSIPEGLYYMKRRYLFFPEAIPALLAQDQAEAKEVPPSAEEPPTLPEVLAPSEEAPAPELTPPPVVYCRYCGQKLLPQSLFCSGCGANISEEGAE